MANNPLSQLLAGMLTEAGVKRAVVSPGTRNAPVIQALADARMELTAVVDERSAAFVALGMAAGSGLPVAMVCTSGSAPLNYAPALAEALYRGIPLVAVSADRPAEWINRADSQTIRQPGALSAVVKHSVTLSPDNIRHSSLLIDEALTAAMKWPRGPVHVNLPVLFTEADTPCPTRRSLTHIVGPDMTVGTARSRELGRLLASPRRVLVVAGGHAPSSKLNRALAKISDMPNVAVVTEPTSNLHGRLFIRSADATLAGCLDDGQLSKLRPDVVLTLGDPIISASLKSFLRMTPGLEHWHIGGLVRGEALPDTFRALTTVVDMPPEAFMPLLASALMPHRAECSFADDWRVAGHRGAARAEGVTARSPWCASQAISAVLRAVPRRWNIQLSNGMTIRHASLAASFCGPWHRVDCNRGVSGIDGSTSTAVGAAMTYTAAPTLLITGDMSALYDSGILLSGLIPPRMRIAVIDNSGGAIFRFARAARDLPCRPALLELEGMRLPLGDIAHGMGMDYHEAGSLDELRRLWPRFEADTGRPAILRIVTDAATDIAVYEEIMSGM